MRLIHCVHQRAKDLQNWYVDHFRQPILFHTVLLYLQKEDAWIDTHTTLNSDSFLSSLHHHNFSHSQQQQQQEQENRLFQLSTCWLQQAGLADGVPFANFPVSRQKFCKPCHVLYVFQKQKQNRKLKRHLPHRLFTTTRKDPMRSNKRTNPLANVASAHEYKMGFQ